MRETPEQRRLRFEAAVAAVEAAVEAAGAHSPRGRLHWDQRAITLCQAGEDDCDFERCPRWRGGKLIDERHCALDYRGDDDA